MFSDKLRRVVSEVERIGTFPPVPAGRFATLLEGATRRALSDDEIVDLINGTCDEGNRELLLEFASAYRRPHDREILLLPPLYFSSICENACRYCSFRNDGVRLDLGEFEREFSFLVDLGFRSLEVVSSQDPDIFVHGEAFSVTDQRFNTDALVPYIRLASRILRQSGGGMLTTNIPPLDVASLRELRDSGLDCFLVWQETFNPTQYEYLHRSNGPKGNQAFRLDSMENALSAGIPHLAGAFLKGLFDWRKEEATLYLFDRHLRETTGQGLSIVGSPRVKGRITESALIRPYQVSDRDYELNIALDRVLFDGILWLQTRESFDFNLELMKRFGAGTILTLLSSTAPGGYSSPATARAQFPVFKQDLERSVRRLEDSGFNVHFAWDETVLRSFNRSGRVAVSLGAA
jgi:2-iminoacetate synthase